MHSADCNDVDTTPEVTASALSVAVANAVHLATLLKAGSYPASD